MEKMTPADKNALRAQNKILTFFEYEHLPPALQEVSAGVCELAWRMAATLPVSAETSVGLRKLLEAKDCFVRAKLAEIAPGKASTQQA